MWEIIVPVTAIIASMCFSFVGIWRGSKKDTKGETQEITMIIVKLEGISNGLNEIKYDIKALRNEIKDHEARLIRIEEHNKKNIHNI